MTIDHNNEIFTKDVLATLFPATKANDFFEALYGDADEGAYDISLSYVKRDDEMLEFALELRQRPGKCLACNLTYGLPEVFSRHPLINIKGLVSDIVKLAGENVNCIDWKFGHTHEVSRKLHIVPLLISIKS